MTALLVAALATMSGCSIDGDEGAKADMQSQQSDERVYITGIYEGEWTVNKQVVDTARMVVRANGEILLRLPESYLLGLCFPDRTDTSPVEPGNTAGLIGLDQQGYSETSQYMSFASEKLQAADAGRFFVSCSFMATIGDKPYSIGLLSYETATAVVQNATGQWTIGITVNAFSLTNLILPANEPEQVKLLPNTVTIYYNTKQRIR